MALSIRPITLTLGAQPWEVKLYRIRPGTSLPSAITVFFIEGAKQKILVDTGATAEGFNKRGSAGYRHVQTVEEGLAKLGLKPDDIELVILTQLHHDHTEGALKFTKAKFLVQKAELDWNLNPPPTDPRPCDKKLTGNRRRL